MSHRVVSTRHLPVAFTYPKGRCVECWLDARLLKSHRIQDPESKVDHQKRLAWTETQHLLYEEELVGTVLRVYWYDAQGRQVSEEQYRKTEKDRWERLT